MLSEINSHSNRLGLYIHWPFCASKCPYCDFNSHVQKDVDVAEWREAFLSELRYMADIYETKAAAPAMLHSVFFGGGTPSLMPVSIISDILDNIGKLFTLAPNLEITAEANPSSTETKQLTSFKTAGINRISIGAQSLNPKTLHFLGRAHSNHDIYNAIEAAMGLFGQVSADFIYGMPEQTINNWQAELNQIIKIGLSHISAYQLTIEPGTQFYTRHNKGETLTCDDSIMADLYQTTTEMLSEEGLKLYEISNYALPDAQCIHNLIYWQSHDWLGIGPGAHGRFTLPNNHRWHSQTRRSPDGWISAVKANQHGIDSQIEDDQAEFAREIILMGLRLSSGINLPEWLVGNTEFINVTWLQQFKEDGLLTFNQNHLRVTHKGRVHLNSIISRLLH
jgi:putative oxygen-independent coproporphyrinogen III oxidase